MLKGWKKTEKFVGNLEDWMVIVTFSAMIVVVMAIVLCRYVFHIRFTSGEEIARYLMIWCGYAGAALGFRTHSHVGVVVFAEMFPKSWQPVFMKLRHILSTVTVSVLFVVSVMCFNQFASSGKLTTATKVPTAAVYIIIPIAMALGILHTIMDIAGDFKKKDGQQESPESEGEVAG